MRYRPDRIPDFPETRFFQMSDLNETASSSLNGHPIPRKDGIASSFAGIWEKIGKKAADLAEDGFNAEENGADFSHAFPFASASAKARLKTFRTFLAGGLAGAVCVLLATSYFNSSEVEELHTAELIRERAAEEQTLTPFAGVSLPLEAENPLQTSANAEIAEIREVVPDKVASYEMKPKESLAYILKKGGLTNREIYKVSVALEEVLELKRIQVGDKIEIGTLTSETGESSLLSVTVEDRKGFRYTATATDDEYFESSMKKPEVELKTEYAESVINGPFIVGAQNAGVPTNVIHQIIWAFDGPVDFERDLRKGDSFTAVFKKEYNMAGQPTGNGELLYASLTLRKKVYERYLYVDSENRPDYYDETGKIARKLFVMHPLKKPRQTSKFGMRKHPILGYSTMHWGADFGAPINTPIRAPGEGTVVKAGKLGSYGQYLRIKHNSEYSSAYAHMARIADSMRVGKRVKAGEIIGYVGNTGRSTGPHLHWELYKNNQRIDPLTQKTTAQKMLSNNELRRFYAARDKIRADLLGDTVMIAKAEALPEARRAAYQGPEKVKKKARPSNRSHRKTAARATKNKKKS